MSDGYIYIIATLVCTISAYMFGRKFREKWWLVSLPFIALIIAGLLFANEAANSKECENAIDSSLCGIGPGMRWIAGYVIAAASTITGLLSLAAAFIGHRRT